jgi:hypothetical protein
METAFPNRLPRCGLIIATIALLLSNFGRSDLLAQCGFSQNFSQAYMVDGSDTVWGANLYAGIQLRMFYTNSLVQYSATEFKKNGSRINLAVWCPEQLYLNWSEQTIADSTRTVNFTLASGDTLSVFRMLTWGDTLGTHRDSVLYTEDTLDYVIELMRASTGTRYARLDSCGLLRCSPAGSPTYYGANELIALIKYAPPSSVPSDSFYIRIRPQARGNGANLFGRKDFLTDPMSPVLNESGLQSYLNKFPPGKRTVRDDVQKTNYGQAEIAAVYNSSDPRVVTLTYDVGGGDHPTPIAIAIYNMNAERQFMPFVSFGQRISGEVRHAFETTGSYFAVLISGGKVLAATPIHITR